MQAHKLRSTLLGGLLLLLGTPVLATPLHDASRNGNVAEARRLIQRGADVNAEDEYGFKPLYLARQEGHSDIIGMLRFAGAREDFSASALRRIQTYLSRLGFYTGAIDGILGGGTEQAIRDYQQSRGDLAVTGEIEEEWVVALYEDITREVQIRLKALGLYDDTIDGVLGPATREAIRTFQQQAELTSEEQFQSSWLDPLWTMADAGAISPSSDTETTVAEVEDAESSPEDSATETTEEDTADSDTATTAEALVGTDSDSLRQIQQRLAALGYDPGDVNGELTPATRVAIREFQEREDLPITGEVSADWVLKLDALILEQTRQQLIDLGFQPEQVRLEPGPQTQQAIREFQERMGMQVTGVVGDDWAQQLREIAEARAAAQAAAQAARERNAQVQTYLAAMGFEPGNQEGNLDVATRQAITNFQEAEGLEVSGEIDDTVAAAVEAALWRHIQTRLTILEVAELAVSGEADDATQSALATFRQNQDLPASDTLNAELLGAINRETIRYIQERLKILGFDPGNLDGNWDNATREAVLAFQTAQELENTPAIRPDWVNPLDREAVRQVQKRLQMLGLNPDNTEGELTSGTRDAILSFQRDADLQENPDLAADWVIALDLAILKSVQARLQSLGIDTGAEEDTNEAPEPEAEDDAGTQLTPPEEETLSDTDEVSTDAEEDPESLAEANAEETETEETAETLAEDDTPDEETIRTLQARLQLLGFDTGTVDGIIGPATREAIRSFQASQQLPVTGEISDDWVEQLDEERLRQTQKLLKGMDLYTGNVDGIMGPATRAAIQRFQEQQDLTIDGNPDDALLSTLQQAEIQRAEELASAEELRGVQSGLQLLGYNVGPVDGQLGSVTREAIRRFQRRNRLPVNGEISAQLQASLQKDLTRLAQRHLRTLNYNVGPVDGELGSTTRRAIRRFQERNRLAVNGDISEDLLRSLSSAVARQEAAIAARQAAEEAARREAAAAARREAERQQAEALANATPPPPISVSPEVLSSIQTNLRALGLYQGDIDGVSGPATERAIRRFQQQAGMAATGNPSNELASHLSQAVVSTPPTPEPQPAASAPVQVASANPTLSTQPTPPVETVALTTPAPSESPAPAPAPAPSWSSEEIRQLQADLGAMGHNPGPVDGTLGQRTRQAIQAFQRQAGVAVTGMPDQNLLALASRQAAEARAQSLRQSGTRTSGGNTEITGKMTFQRSNGGSLIGCSVGNIQLDMAWCNTFASRRDLDDCRVILRPNAKVLVVNCV